ncbi:MAG: imidazole glycerol phosphate synthase subunit HisH [Verrucomicrobiota bacterium]|nr:imidazole glycerol phosphate synthase subunit HisH [Verrucomicrobiota bacterium]
MISIINYNAGNLTSVKRALDYLGIKNKITTDKNEIENAERIIFPGVGHAATALKILRERGLDSALLTAFNNDIPIMGICLGTQIILSHSDESNTDCLNIISGNCSRFNLRDKSLSIPHMGWNAISITKKHYILKDVKDADEFYFVHSFYPVPEDKNNIYARCEYEIEFAAAIGRKNLFATQFHPEKSGEAGLQILKNFSEWEPDKC